jgi:hypothetical protein
VKVREWHIEGLRVPRCAIHGLCRSYAGVMMYAIPPGPPATVPSAR